jgi:hypothetical protein
MLGAGVGGGGGRGGVRGRVRGERADIFALAQKQEEREREKEEAIFPNFLRQFFWSGRRFSREDKVENEVNKLLINGDFQTSIFNGLSHFL